MKKAKSSSLIAILFSLITPNAEALTQPLFTIDQACTSKEVWTANKGRGSTLPWIQEHSRLNSSDLLDWFAPLSSSYRGPVVPGVSDYLIARAFYRAGLFHLAFKRFQRSLSRPEPEAKPLRVASAQCLYLLQKEHPSFRLARPSLTFLIQSMKDAPEVMRKTIAISALRLQLKSEELPPEVQSSPTERAFLKLVLATQAATNSHADPVIYNLKEAIKLGQTILKDPVYLPFLELAQTTLARVVNLAGRYAESNALAMAFAKTHPQSGENIELMAWNFWQLKKANEANGQALTLRTAGLKNYFAPQTSLIPSMIFLENCQYDQAKAWLDYFRVAYRSEHAYFVRPGADRYRDLMLTLQGKAKIVPAKVISEWLKRSSVSALLTENNLIVDERDTGEKIRVALRGALKSKLITDAALKLIQGDLNFLDQHLKQSESRNIEMLQRKLNEVTDSLKFQLESATQNAALMEVDVLLALSKKAGAATPSPSPGEKAKSAPEWDWGKRVSAQLEDEEVWLDELGAYRVPVENRCK